MGDSVSWLNICMIKSLWSDDLPSFMVIRRRLSLMWRMQAQGSLLKFAKVAVLILCLMDLTKATLFR